MKVGLVVPRLTRGGGSRSQLTLCHELNQLGVSCTVFSSTAGEQVWSEFRPYIRYVKAPRITGYLGSSVVASVAAASNSDLVVTTFAPDIIPARLACVCFRARLIHFARHFDPFLLDARKLGNRVLASLFRFGSKWSYSLVTWLVANSRWTLRKVRAYAPFARRTAVIPNGISDVFLETPLNNQQVVRNGFERRMVVGVVGKSQAWKGLSDLDAAVSQVVQKDDREILLRIITSEKSPLRVEYGFVEIIRPSSDIELIRAIDECDIFVSPSWYEGFGNPALEAMARQRPVITTANGGCREYARHNINCWIVPPRNSKLLARAISILSADPDLRKRLAEAGRRTATDFRWDASVEAFRRYLRSTSR